MYTTRTLFSSTVQILHTHSGVTYIFNVIFRFLSFWKLFNTAEKKHTHHYLVKLQIKQVMISFSFFSLYYYLSFTKQNMYIIYIYIYLSSCLFIIFWNCIIMIRSGVIYCFLFFLLYLYISLLPPHFIHVTFLQPSHFVSVSLLSTTINILFGFSSFSLRRRSLVFLIAHIFTSLLYYK